MLACQLIFLEACFKWNDVFGYQIDFNAISGAVNLRDRKCPLNYRMTQLQFEFTNGYEMLHKAWNSKGEMPYSFPRSSIKFQGHTVQNITDFDPNSAFPDYRPVAAFKSLRFALFIRITHIAGNQSVPTHYPYHLRTCFQFDFS